MNSWYQIKDLTGFINHARELVFKSFGQINEEANDNILTYDECLIMIKNHIKTKISKKTKKESYYINDTILGEILESFNSRMVSNILAKLVNDGLLDSAFDTEKNDFIFWVIDKK